MDTYSAALAGLIIAALGVGIVVAAIVAAIKYPVYWLFGLVVLVLAVSCSKADDLRTFEVSVIIEQESDRAAAAEAVSSAAYLWRTQLGTDIVATYYDVSRVAEHTKPETLLAAVSMYRTDNAKHRAADATVLFTTRELTRRYEGVATIGPACSASAAAVVRLRTDGLDGEVMAHELLHTVGVPHDHAAGWLMSESLARTSAPSLSPDSVRTFMAAPLDCTAKIEPRAVVQSGGGEPPTGGGGAFDWQTVLMMFGLAVIMWLQNRHLKACQDSEREHIVEISKLTRELISRVPSDFILRDVSGVTTQTLSNGERLVLVKFHTVAGMTDFAKWVQEQANHSRVYPA
jgi:hypothetical protein